MNPLLVLALVLGAASATAAPKSVRVFVALCDNKTRGIQPVGERISPPKQKRGATPAPPAAPRSGR